MKQVFFFCFALVVITSFTTPFQQVTTSDNVIGYGKMPALTKDNQNRLHLVYGNGDSLWYCVSTNAGRSFSQPELVCALPHVFTFASRGPQIAYTSQGLIVTACTSEGSIYSFRKKETGGWLRGAPVNDRDTTAIEGLMSLSGDGNKAYAVWLDVRDNNRNKIVGASSSDGGQSWSANTIIYTSPDSTVCECCKPSVVLKNNKVYVMFRNFIHGNRDLYLIRSNDGGKQFGLAEKLGTGSWQLNACPMDGGGLRVDQQAGIQTVWRRKNNIYSAVPGKPEITIGEGKSCTLTTLHGKTMYVWIENGDVVLLSPGGTKTSIGKGKQPIIEAVDDEHVVCIREQENQIISTIVSR